MGISPPLTAVSAFGTDVSGNAFIGAGVATLAVLMVLSAFFSSSEIAMFSIPRHRIDALVEEGRSGADAVAALKSDPHRLLITILVGNNLVNIAMSSIATGLFATSMSQGKAVLAATFGVTALVLLFGRARRSPTPLRTPNPGRCPSRNPCSGASDSCIRWSSCSTTSRARSTSSPAVGRPSNPATSRAPRSRT